MMSQTAGLRKGENDGAVIKSEALEVCNKKNETEKSARAGVLYIEAKEKPYLESCPSIQYLYIYILHLYRYAYNTRLHGVSFHPGVSS